MVNYAVIDCCGDGGASLICHNYGDAASWLADYLVSIESIGWELDIRNDHCLINRDQENIILSNNVKYLHPYNELNFLISKDCKFGFTSLEDKRILKSI